MTVIQKARSLTQLVPTDAYSCYGTLEIVGAITITIIK